MKLKQRIYSLSPEKQQLLSRRLMDADVDKIPVGPTVKTQQLLAYIVADDILPPTAEELKNLLKRSLPEYMVPQAFIFIDKIPLLPNGKVDLKALSEQELERTPSSVEFAQAENPVEEKLSKIWSSVLGMDLIGIHDNFFEIGGDSILSIQITARAKEAGIHITPKQIFQNLTIAELARAAEAEQTITAEQGLVTGDVPLTPIQHWLLGRNLPNPDYWNQAAMLKAPKNLNLDILHKALERLMHHHDALRACFKKQSDIWIQNFSETVSIHAVDEIDLSQLNDEQQAVVIKDNASIVQAALNIEKGQLVTAAYFNMGNTSPDNRLCIAVHHLSIDAVSWNVLLEDLNTLYYQLIATKTVSLPDKTTSYKDWSNALIEYAESDELKTELEYWLSLPNANVFDIPFDKAAGDNTESSEQKYTVTLTEKDTRVLLKDVPHIYNTKINDILLTAMAQTINAWTCTNIFSFDMEGHGREQINGNIDLYQNHRLVYILLSYDSKA